MPDLLAGANWSMLRTDPGACSDPTGLPDDGWVAASVPGTVAAVLTAAGIDPGTVGLDGSDWWWRTVLPCDTGDAVLQLQGLATVADVWLDGRHRLASSSMWLSYDVGVNGRAGQVLAIRFAALAPLLAQRRPRPRWKASGLSPQGIRWWRTSLLGRMPGISPTPVVVGPWRPLSLLPATECVEVSWRTTVTGEDGKVSFLLSAVAGPVADIEMSVGGHSVTVSPAQFHAMPDGGWSATAELVVPAAPLWWPAGYGAQPLLPVMFAANGSRRTVGSAGFRTLTADAMDGGMRITVNGVEIFCRGAVWVPPDPIGLNPDPRAVRADLTALRDAGATMIRINGAAVYEDGDFLSLCDELGLLVWQDLMLARSDPPDDEGWLDELAAEVSQLGRRAGSHPCLTVICGGSEVHQQAGMLGLDADRRSVPVLSTRVASMVADALPETTFVPSSPWAGDRMAFRPDAIVAHYFGVGAYRRPLADARTAGVRFASECLAFAIPPEPALADIAGIDAADLPVRGVPRDGGADWDFADVTRHYTGQLWPGPPEAAPSGVDRVELARATAALTIASTMATWRRPRSGCRGALMIASRDLVAGSGWGLLDASGAPKAPWWPLRAVLSPIALLVTDEGLGGLAVHVVNDTAEDVEVVVVVEAIAGNRLVESGTTTLTVPTRGGTTCDAEVVLGGFRDVTAAYSFGPPAYDVVTVTAQTSAGKLLGRHVHWPGGRPWPGPEGPEGTLWRDAGGTWLLDVHATTTVQQVTVRAAGFRPDDSWFDLPAGAARTITLLPHTAPDTSRPRVLLGHLGGTAVPVTTTGQDPALEADHVRL